MKLKNVEIKFDSSKSNDYEQFYLGKDRIPQIKNVIVEFENGLIERVELMWISETSELDGVVYTSTIPYVVKLINGNRFLANLRTFKRVSFIRLGDKRCS